MFTVFAKVYPEQDGASPNPHNLFFKILFNIILPSKPWSLPPRFSDKFFINL